MWLAATGESAHQGDEAVRVIVQRTVPLDGGAELAIVTGSGGRFVPKGDELLAEVGERVQLGINHDQLLVDQLAQVAAGLLALAAQGQKLTDFLQREPDGARLADEGQPLAVGIAVQAVAGLGAPRCGQQADVLVVADGLGVDAELGGEFANAQRAMGVGRLQQYASRTF